MTDELLTSAFGLFAEELPVVFLVTWIENCELVWRNPLLISALGCDFRIKTINKKLAEGNVNLFFLRRSVCLHERPQQHTV